MQACHMCLLGRADALGVEEEEHLGTRTFVERAERRETLGQQLVPIYPILGQKARTYIYIYIYIYLTWAEGL